jgi:deoxyribodipyrimidine photo-lyase
MGVSMAEDGLAARIRTLNRAPIDPEGEYVLYWMTGARRPGWSHALDRSVGLARELDKPLVVLEALRAGYRWASDRHHAFIIDGMRANAEHFARRPVSYYPYIEPVDGQGSGLLVSLAERSSAVVTDDVPGFFLPRMIQAVAPSVPVRMEAVDGNGIVPMRTSDRLFTSAYHFRRHLQRALPEWLDRPPSADPLAGVDLPTLAGLPRAIVSRWPVADLRSRSVDIVSRLPIDHDVGVTGQTGGYPAARAMLSRFLEGRLRRYDAERNLPSASATSGLSPYLHYGHLSPHEIVLGLLHDAGWVPENIPTKATGARNGWWGLGPSAEAFLDQVITWRELGFNRAALQPEYQQFHTLPEWALRTLDDHSADPRPYTYTLAEFEHARTHDELWNAAQRQLTQEGVIHNYLRMLWGKKILEWCDSPRDALDVMVELNNKYALDGRDPNSYNGIMWVLGRFDRGWPERAVFGTVRSMSSVNTARKVDVSGYLRRYGAGVREQLAVL